MLDRSFREQRKNLVQRLKDEGVIHSNARGVTRAIRAITRDWFLPKSVVEGAYVYVPLRIGYE